MGFWLRFLLFVFGLPAVLAQPLLLLGAEDDWYPYAALREGQPAGMAVELVRAAYAEVGIQVRLQPLPYARCMKLTQAGRLAGCFNTLRNPLIEQQYRWHAQPLFRGRIGIYARNGMPQGEVDIHRLRGKRIAITNGYDYGAAFDGDPTMRRDVGQSDLDALRKLAAGRVDYALVYDRIVAAILREHPGLRGRIHLVGTLIEPDIYVSFSRKHADAARASQLLDEGLTRLRKRGEYARIEARWQ
ncbi:ABC transporter substrate-binding protein [Chitinimonas sp. BJYL2]|uniref:substrate-binding periplasmic protein n=1 Tax=Chitinimonas sp. BJYL2 TaxID=2976696 RepID=UPI0022B587E4|nr:transporter substrate-binding domain-containing protein [Chitinimonas sp. BJYL2]